MAVDSCSLPHWLFKTLGYLEKSKLACFEYLGYLHCTCTVLIKQAEVPLIFLQRNLHNFCRNDRRNLCLQGVGYHNFTVVQCILFFTSYYLKLLFSEIKLFAPLECWRSAVWCVSLFCVALIYSICNVVTQMFHILGFDISVGLRHSSWNVWIGISSFPWWNRHSRNWPSSCQPVSAFICNKIDVNFLQQSNQFKMDVSMFCFSGILDKREVSHSWRVVLSFRLAPQWPDSD